MNENLYKYLVDNLFYSVKDCVDNGETEERMRVVDIYTQSCTVLLALEDEDLSLFNSKQLSLHFPLKISEEIHDWYEGGRINMDIFDRISKLENSIICSYIEGLRTKSKISSYEYFLLYQCSSRAFLTDEIVNTVEKAEEILLPKTGVSILQRNLLRRVMESLSRKKEKVKDLEYFRNKVSSSKDIISNYSGYLESLTEISKLYVIFYLRYFGEMEEPYYRGVKEGEIKKILHLFKETVQTLYPLESADVCLICNSFIIICKDHNVFVDSLQDLKVIRREDFYTFCTYKTGDTYIRYVFIL